METVYLAYETARWYWENAKRAVQTLQVAKRCYVLKDAATSAHAIQSIAAGTIFENRPLSAQANKKGMSSSERVTLRCVSRKLPRDSYIQLSSSICIASPELSFLQAAEDLSLYQTILYGCALCGSFVLDPSTKSGTAYRLPLTTKKKLAAFIARCEGLRGFRVAQRALQYILEGSASPRESKVGLLLSLPLCHGGYGLSALKLNYEIAVPSKLRKLVGRKTLRADFFWENSRVAAEYDSDADHRESHELCNDATKRIALQEMGFVPFGFTKMQVDQLVLMDESVAALRKLLGVRAPKYLPRDYEERKRRLRKELGI